MAKTSDHDLIVRIDERQATMQTRLSNIDKKFEAVVQYDDDYKDMLKEHKSLWDSKNKAIGWMFGAGITGGGVGSLLVSIAKNVLANVK